MHLQVAMEVLGWHKQEVCDILTSQMQVAPLLSDQNWATKRLRNVKFTSVHAVLLTLGQVCLFNSSTIKLQENYLFKIVNMPNTHFNKIPVSRVGNRGRCGKIRFFNNQSYLIFAS